MQVVVGLDPPERSDRPLPARPEQLPLCLVPGQPDGEGLVPLQDLADLADQLLGGLGEAVHLDQQHRARVGRVAGVVVGLDRADGRLVHHLERRRHDAVADDVGHRVAGGLDRREAGQQGVDRLRDGQQLHLDPGDHAHRPSDPTSTPSRSSPGRSGSSPPTQWTLPSASTTSMPRTWLVVTP